MAIIIDGKAAAAGLRQGLASEVRAIEAAGGPVPGLRVVIVGDHPASRTYVRTKTKVAQEIGIDGALVELPATVTTAELLAVVGELNDDPTTHGILVQLPLPAQVDAARILAAIDPAKDVDGFHPLNVGRLFASSRPSAEVLLVPCTPLGCMHLLAGVHGPGGLSGAHAVVLGRSNIVGKPMAALLLGADCTVTVAHSKTRDLAGLCRSADVLVAAVGRPRLVQGDWLKPGATVLDVGINRVEGLGLVGDVDFEAAVAVAGAITPVPGGVGPMTVASLMRNTLTAYRLQVGALA
ncbi:MAG: bifunctional methylenetetrahydrofolate dehydrogenase/methenyltetrahydrofolate cyclohydrolase [Geminicoccaceae bacterium]|nr:MAG: bifunctional methylenetetrahydrofolate dehydrogenase/methenyltetrahydrofolate cyclohydrolase [Geminicoccaceae bacterium]